eukprot:TRINITY_DN11411_c0_g1_i5.p2 TRINITY_DN11411_c0_g1~~TRINITY_DN11411_c0_g1_i5.p2  ORF type:complete len:356 (+),score=48.59 TRINITY_DN11411_c0_g1_i5:90-1157(+)
MLRKKHFFRCVCPIQEVVLQLNTKMMTVAAILFVVIGVATADGLYQWLESLGSKEMLQRLATQAPGETINPYFQDSYLLSLPPPTTPYTASISCSDPLALFCDMEALLNFKMVMSSDAQTVLESWKGSNPCDGSWIGITCADVLPGIPRVVQIQLGKFYYTKHAEENRWLEMFNAQHVPYINADIIEDIGDKMVFLEVLNLKGCNVRGLPESLKHLSKMQVFSLGDNKLSTDPAQPLTVPTWLSRFEDLRVIDMQNTGIAGELPANFASWKLIEIVNFYYNHLTGAIPVEYESWIDPSSYPHLHYFLVGSADDFSSLCISQETKTAFEQAVIMGGTDVVQLPLCDQIAVQQQLVK